MGKTLSELPRLPNRALVEGSVCNLSSTVMGIMRTYMNEMRVASVLFICSSLSNSALYLGGTYVPQTNRGLTSIVERLFMI